MPLMPPSIAKRMLWRTASLKACCETDSRNGELGTPSSPRLRCSRAAAASKATCQYPCCVVARFAVELLDMTSARYARASQSCLLPALTMNELRK